MEIPKKPPTVVNYRSANRQQLTAATVVLGFNLFFHHSTSFFIIQPLFHHSTSFSISQPLFPSFIQPLFSSFNLFFQHFFSIKTLPTFTISSHSLLLTLILPLSSTKCWFFIIRLSLKEASLKI